MDFYQGTPNLPMTGGDIFTDLTTDITTLNNTVVFKAGTQTITGAKTLSGTTTFTGDIVANALTITPTELGYIDGLTSNAQTQLNGKVSIAGTETITGNKTFSGTTTYTGDIVANALTITPTELGYIDGLTSNAQTQLNGKVSIAGTETISGSKTFSGTTTFTNNIVANALTITPTELGYIDGLTSNAQTQITARALDSAVVHLAGTETITGDKTFSGTTTYTGSIVANAQTITPTELGFIATLTSDAQTQITARALDSAVVHLAGTETITGSKTFSTTTTFSVPPVSATDPSASNQVANKSYVDAAVGGVGAVTLTGTQTITGDKTFSGTTTFTNNIVSNAQTITPTELGYIATLTSDAQTQITARALDSAVVHLAGTETITGAKTFSGTTTFTGDIVANSQTITPTELGYIATLTSDAQTQITARALDSAVVHLAGTETITGAKTFTTTLIVDTANRDTILEDTGISTSHPASGTSFSVNSTDLSSINATNTLSAGTLNSLVNTGLAVGSTAIANSLSTTGGYNRITSGTSSILANEITATGGGGNSMTTAGAGTTSVRSLGTGTALFFTNSGKNTLGSTSGQVELSTSNLLTAGILIKNNNTGSGGIRIESDGASGSMALDSAGTFNANTDNGKNSLSSTTGAIELITGSASATGINIENTNATTGGIRLKTTGTSGDISITSADDITITSADNITITSVDDITIQSTTNTGGNITIEVGTLTTATGLLRLDANSGTIEMNSSNLSIAPSYVETTYTIYAPKFRIGTFSSSQPLLSYQLHGVKRGTSTSGFLLLQPSFESSTTNAQDWLILPCDVRFLRYAIMYDNDSGTNTTIDFAFKKKTSNTATPTTPYTLSFTTSVSTARTNTQGGAINTTAGVTYAQDEIIGFDYSGAPANEFGIIFYASQE
jgi:hypothetical protein